VPEALRIGIHIADGVQVAHAEQAIHRDLKPENVFILPDNVAKVLDFGIAKFLDHGSLTTQKDHIHGTMLYMSPEHLQGKAVTPRSDVYALGTILYEAMAGRPPALLGMTEITMNAVAWAQINRMPPPLNELNDTVPSHVARIVQRMIAKDPADRFASMQEVSTALRSAAERIASEGGASGMRRLWERTEHVTKANALVNPHTAITKEALPSEEQPTTRIASEELDGTGSPDPATRAFEPAELLARALEPRPDESAGPSGSSASGIPSPHTVSGVSTAVQVPTPRDYARSPSGHTRVWSVAWSLGLRVSHPVRRIPRPVRRRERNLI
jgi:serine/threonine protein kinase